MPKVMVMAKKKSMPPMEEAESEALTCPKCGMELADTPKNRKYAAMREQEMSDEYEEDEEE